ncbi:hypothetical protein R1flu_010929 [Riccia fluitans]|uniref:Uncharacterized protein n=1 Tax=Riccia fluitans TaxID=41844 RepID=A0ABD1Z9H2_9MARC
MVVRIQESGGFRALVIATSSPIPNARLFISWGGGAVGHPAGVVTSSDPERRLKRWLPRVESQDEHKIGRASEGSFGGAKSTSFLLGGSLRP